MDSQVQTMVKNMRKQVNDMLTKVEETEKRCAELQKKNEDYKRGYNEVKATLGKA